MSDKKLIELRRNKMGMVFQSFALLPHKTVLENIAFPLQVKGTSTPDAMKRAKEMVDLVSLTGRENYFPRQLFGRSATTRRNRALVGSRTGYLVPG